MKVLMKVSSDKNHYVGHIPFKKQLNTYNLKKTVLKDSKYIRMEELLDEAIRKDFDTALSKSDNANIEIKNFICDKLIEEKFAENNCELREYVNEYVNKRVYNTYQRIRRVHRKINFHHADGAYFNYFCTITYDDRLFNSEEEFKKKFNKCIENFCTRRGWKVMVRMELGHENERMHFHMFAHIPYGQLPGGLTLMSTPDSKIKWRRNYRHENEFFRRTFGMNDFEEISSPDKSIPQGVIEYFLKYGLKGNFKVKFSRGLPEEMEVEVDIDKDVAFVFDGKVMTKYVLFDTTDIYQDYMSYYARMKEKVFINKLEKYKNSLVI